MHESISIVREADDELAAAPAVGWAIGRLRAALESNGARVDVLDRPPTEDAGTTVFVAGSRTALAGRMSARAGVSIPQVPEALGLVPGEPAGPLASLACGADVRGLVYAVLELADRAEHATDPLAAIRIERPIVERPANAVRSVARLFASEVDDKPWLHDEGFWRRYLSMVAAQRFNRVNLMVGLGYNFPWHITDSYLYFAYPFLVDVPGSGVRVPQLPDDERDRNLAMLRFISDEAVARGLDFQFGMWTHAYEWFESAEAPYTIEGLDPEHHAAYCGDAIGALLDACPSIGGLTIRTHGESGVPERSWDFWKVVFDGIVRSGRHVGLDLHAKGVDQETLDLALATGLPVTLSPKFSAEHMGLPYHQTAMRELDRPPTGRDGARVGKARFMNVSEGSRPFTRYSYGDFLREDRPYDVVFRIWPGTQRVLLWGDPAMAAGFGRNAGIAGSEGLEWCEPLSLKGREGTGLPPRDGYRDASLSTPDDWEQHAYTFRLFGRLLYEPDAEPETWRRALRTSLGPLTAPAEAALASASRILPLVTSAHHPSASNNYYWPEVYTDIAIVGEEGSVETHYYDTPTPKRFGTVGPLDPELFLTAKETAREIVTGRRSGRYSALEVAGWLEGLSAEASDQLGRLEEVADPPPAVRRFVADIAILEAIGRFFAGKLRAAVWYEISSGPEGVAMLDEALDAYRGARDALAEAAELAAGVYVDDLTFGPQAWLRGTWSDRLPAIDRDVDALSALAQAAAGRPDGESRATILAAAAKGGRTSVVSHTPPTSFRRGEPIPLSVRIGGAGAAEDCAVRLRYRPVDQSRTYAEQAMERSGDRFVAPIPGPDSDTPFAIQYLFTIHDADGGAWLHPGLGADLSDQPYYVVRPLDG
jgi:hypothetical protein